MRLMTGEQTPDDIRLREVGLYAKPSTNNT